MARRNRTIVDGVITETDPDSSIRDTLRDAGFENENLPPSVVSGGEIISAPDYNRPAPTHGMLINQTDITKGGTTLRSRLLNKEYELISRFLAEFHGKPRSIELKHNYLLIRAFPLPDSYVTDHVDLLFIITGYYDVPPAGLHIPRNTPNRDQIVSHLGGHVNSGTPSYVLEHTPAIYREEVKKLADLGWDWICYHYKDWAWKLNTQKLLAGDCLFKYVENCFAALSGNHR